ncbi:MAG: UDP-N-acetylglucosamine--N-acetylmuramyl-(pentapeptide) pyrophosphoryl-undecaprenol N-acetylglucosamine transferase, partial [Coriobacteriales bacterium]
MKFVISGGGTAGHIYPAIAVGKALEDMGHEVLFAGTPNGLEAKLAPQAGFQFKAFEVSGFNRHHPTTLFKSSVKALKSSSAAKKWLTQIGADCIVGFGGYVSIPVGKAAEDLGIPLVIHEQNSACGMANKYLAPHASAIALTYEAAARDLKSSCPMVITGDPVRPEILSVDADAARGVLRIPDEAEFLFVFGGSLGARHINTAIVKLAPKLLARDNLYIVHVTGPKEYDTVKADLSAAGIETSGPGFDVDNGWENPGARYMLTGYFEHMGEAISASDVIVSRSGATSLAEITAVGAVALLVPYPFATDDHQTKNAQALVESGASYMCPDDQVESGVFEQKLFDLLDNPEKRAEMREKTRKLGRVNAAKKVAALAVQAAEKQIRTEDIDAI